MKTIESIVDHDIGRFLNTSWFEIGDTRVTPLLIAGSLLVVIAAWWISRIAERAVIRLTQRRSQHVSQSTAFALGRLTRYLLAVIVLLIGLSMIGYDLTSLTVVGGALGIGVGFGLQNMVANFVSGIVLLLDQSLKVGDFVELESGVTGQVRAIAMRYTRVTTNDSVDILVPNSEFINGRVTNWTFDDAARRIHVPFGVAYGSDKQLVKEAGIAAAGNLPGIILDDESRRPDVWLVGFGDSSLNFELVVWVDHRLTVRPAATSARLLWAIESELAARKLEIPFPQRDLHVRSGSLRVKVERAETDGKSD
ncbi:MAG: mechanosensitive ion channel [Steroidobacteraceae bacterium]